MTVDMKKAEAEVLLLFTTVPNAESAGQLAEALVAEHLAACVNQIPGLRSTYRWKGEICRETELLLIIKTRRDRLDAVKARILALHPYELPEIVAVEAAGGHVPYLDWIREQCAPRE